MKPYVILNAAMTLDGKIVTAQNSSNISGKDDLSIKNVAFISFEERLITPPEPKTSEDILVGEDENFFLNHDKKKR